MKQKIKRENYGYNFFWNWAWVISAILIKIQAWKTLKSERKNQWNTNNSTCHFLKVFFGRKHSPDIGSEKQYKTNISKKLKFLFEFDSYPYFLPSTYSIHYGPLVHYKPAANFQKQNISYFLNLFAQIQ